ncbi:MAG TPA: carboxypeptidase-like regulatory domain-containing protein [Longimicrobium sp.]|nr:carboxypeptidase-like regulatory domain-containing protein [Longimicrobium sp.]
MRFTLAIVLACSAIPGALASQTVSGTLVRADGGAPLAGATVTLLDEQGRPVAAASSRADGGFTLTAPAAGRYRVRADRVGHASTTSAAVALAAGETFTLRLEAGGRGVQLEGIKATAGDRGCVVNPRAGARTAAVWEEARKVLSATRLSERNANTVYTIRRFRREMDGATAMTRSAQEDTTRGRSVVPFRSLPPEELARDGYVRREGRENVFFAPDAQVLLSDEFLDGHCFRVVPGSGAAAGMIGLAFEPVRGRRLPDVQGTLWLDPASAELRFMEFAYTGLAGIATDEGWGGTVEFDQTGAGTWIVNRWTLRLPVVGRMVDSRGRNLPNARAGVVGISEVGAEVLGVGAPAAAGVVTGTVFDSTRARPLAGAVVRLAGTGHTATTDAFGAFRIAEVPAGRYEVEFSHPRADSLQWKPVAAEVAVAAGESAVQLSLPRRAAPVVVAGRDTLRVVQLEGVTGSAAAQTRTLTRLGFYERKERGFGTQMTGDEFRDKGRGRITDHISGTKRIFARPTGDDDGITFLQSRLGLTCWVPVFVDARRVPAKELHRLRREDIVAVEIYEGTDVPGEFNIAAHYNSSGRRRACGAIVVWTTQAR